MKTEQMLTMVQSYERRFHTITLIDTPATQEPLRCPSAAPPTSGLILQNGGQLASQQDIFAPFPVSISLGSTMATGPRP